MLEYFLRALPFSSYYLLLGFLFLLIFIKVFKKPRYGTKFFTNNIFKGYRAQSSLFVNRSEFLFFKVLQRKFSSRYYIMSKVRLEDIITTKANLSNKRKWELRGRIKSRHVDFLLIDRRGKPVLALELDGSSHITRWAGRSDRFKDNLFLKTGVPMGRVNVGQNFDKELERLESLFRL